ncbi:MAG: T9SS type A sorting domain-containing protein [Flavobacterium sp.]|nr:T9SS type A sorting domain-containing protein [Flavobacterium sp.]
MMSQCFTSISTKGFHNVAIRNDGSLWSWGDNEYRQNGNNSNVDILTPLQITATLDWSSISLGTFNSAAVKTDGTIWYWGRNYQGSTCCATIPTPQQIIGFDNFISIASGLNTTAAIKSNGTLWAWGWNEYGVLGNGTTISSQIPVQVGTDNNWQSVSIGANHISAIKTDGSLWAWGRSITGSIGNNVSGNQTTPLRIGTANNWLKVYSGYDSNLAIKTDGTLWAWGWNSYGQLGDGTTTNRVAPVQIGNDNDWVEISITTHSMAIKSNGTLWAWGFNNFGKLGIGSSLNQVSVPTQLGTDSNWLKSITGFEHTIALKVDGTLWAWGRNNNGQLGDGTIINKSTPIQIEIACNPLSTDNFYDEIPAIYPNPVDDILNFKFENKSEFTNISVLNLQGKLLMEVKNGQPSIDISNLSSGIYICRIQFENKIFNLKIIKN